MNHPSSGPDPALSFASVADAYDRARPTYPRPAVEWLTGRSPATVVELGAGTGKLTDRLVELRHDLLVTDPLDAMLEHVRERHPDLRVVTASAEAVPVATRSVDVVVAAQAFHWFDAEAALREAARMLKPEGRIALAWNVRDERIPWVKRLGRIIGESGPPTDPSETLVASRHFGYVETETFKHWMPMKREALMDLVRSRSNVAVMDPSARDRVLRKVGELFAEYDRSSDGLMLPYVTHCYRAVVRPRGLIDEPEHSADLTAAAEAVRRGETPSGLDQDTSADGTARRTATSTGDDDGPTLISFR